mgnify:CR=1 FL=1
MNKPQRCIRCIMDNSSDETITFDDNGVCNYCTSALELYKSAYFPNEVGKEKLEVLLKDIKERGKHSKYDCVMGLSGGLDSSYLAFLGHKWGLRVLAIHIDDGFDTEISKKNLKNLISATGFDYEVVTPDSRQFNALTKAFMKAGVPNLAIPQDNVLFAFLYKMMKKHKLKYFLSGANFALESILQQGNTHTNSDVVNIRDINKKFGDSRLNNLKFISLIRSELIIKRVLKIQTISPLNYIDYNKDAAFKELFDFCGFEYYGRKHLENILTTFIQLYWFPKKFGVDKRTSHLSSLIISGQLTRDEALQLMNEPLYDESQMKEYIAIIKNQLRISNEEFDVIMSSPTHQHDEYKTLKNSILLPKPIIKILRIMFRLT